MKHEFIFGNDYECIPLSLVRNGFSTLDPYSVLMRTRCRLLREKKTPHCNNLAQISHYLSHSHLLFYFLCSFGFFFLTFILSPHQPHTHTHKNVCTQKHPDTHAIRQTQKRSRTGIQIAMHWDMQYLTTEWEKNLSTNQNWPCLSFLVSHMVQANMHPMHTSIAALAFKVELL